MQPQGLYSVLRAVLGIGNGASLINSAVGAVTHTAFLPTVVWLAAHANEQVSFSASYGFLALVAGVTYLLLEVSRRSRPEH